MIFFFKKKKKVIDCFTSNQMVYEQFPIAKANEYIPDWYKKLNATYSTNVPNTLREKAATVKRCPGISNLFNEGFILPLWSDLIFDFSPVGENFEFKWEYAATDPTWNVEVHDSQQYSGLFNNNFFQTKLTVPWLVKESTGVKFAFIEPTYTMSNPNIFTVIPGVINFKYQNFVNVNMLTEITTPMKKRIEFEAGEPLAQIIPLTEDDVVLKTHYVSKEEYNRIDESTSAYKWYGTYFDRKKKKEKVCPIRKGKIK